MTPAPTAAEVQLVRDAATGAPHLAGLRRCGSAWACSLCAPVIREGRAREIDAAIALALSQGLYVYFVTATVSHKYGDRLKDVHRLVTRAWRAAFGGRAAQEWAESSGYLGQVRAIEVTYGLNGWHPHVHALLVFDRPWNPNKLDRMVPIRPRSRTRVPASLDEVFAYHVGRLGGFCDVSGAASPGWRVERVGASEAIAGYLTKVADGWGAGQEIARGDVKTGRRKGLAPFEILDQAIEGDRRSAALWRVYEEATLGTRSIHWSPALRKRLKVVDADDEAMATVEPIAPEIICSWTHEQFAELYWSGRICNILAVFDPVLAVDTG